MYYNKKLKRLRAVMTAECDRRMKQDHELRPDEVAEWLLHHQGAAVIDGLTDLVCQVMEQGNDNERVERILRANPQPEDDVRMMRSMSETLGVPLWFLLTLEPERAEDACAAAILIHRLRADEIDATREAMQRAMEFLRPVTDGHPEMTVEQALGELERKTDATIQGLESTGESL